MKPKIHPKTYTATVSCACGVSFETLSTVENITTEICSKCHPFFTGEQKFVDSAQRLKKFEEKQKRHQSMQGTNIHKNKKEKLAARKAKKSGGVQAKTDAKKALKDAKKALADL